MRVVRLAVVVAMALALWGCHPDPENPDPPPVTLPPVTTPPTTPPTTTPPPPPTPPAAPVIASAVDKGFLPFPANSTGRDDGYAVALGGKMLWMFGDTGLARASSASAPSGWVTRMRSSTAQYSPKGSNLGLAPVLNVDYSVDAQQTQLEFCTLTPAEIADNVAWNVPGGKFRRHAHWPNGGIVRDSQSAWIFYSSLYCENANCEDKYGTFVDVVRAGKTVTEGAPVRVFAPGEQVFRPNGLVEGGYAYLTSAKLKDAACGLLCGQSLLLGRVRPTDAAVRAKYEFWNGTSWGADINAAARVVDVVSPQGTISFNSHLGKYLMVDQEFMSPTAKVRVAKAVTGPWSEGTVIHGQPTESVFGNYFFIEHPELARDGGKTLVLSYSNDPPGAVEMNIRILELTLP